MKNLSGFIKASTGKTQVLVRYSMPSFLTNSLVWV